MAEQALNSPRGEMYPSLWVFQASGRTAACQGPCKKKRAGPSRKIIFIRRWFVHWPYRATIGQWGVNFFFVFCAFWCFQGNAGHYLCYTSKSDDGEGLSDSIWGFASFTTGSSIYSRSQPKLAGFQFPLALAQAVPLKYFALPRKSMKILSSRAPFFSSCETRSWVSLQFYLSRLAMGA